MRTHHGGYTYYKQEAGCIEYTAGRFFCSFGIGYMQCLRLHILNKERRDILDWVGSLLFMTILGVVMPGRTNGERCICMHGIGYRKHSITAHYEIRCTLIFARRMRSHGSR